MRFSVARAGKARCEQLLEIGRMTYPSPDFQKGKLRPRRGSLCPSHTVKTEQDQDLNPDLLASWAQWLHPPPRPRPHRLGPKPGLKNRQPPYDAASIFMPPSRPTSTAWSKTASCPALGTLIQLMAGGPETARSELQDEAWLALATREASWRRQHQEGESRRTGGADRGGARAGAWRQTGWPGWGAGATDRQGLPVALRAAQRPLLPGHPQQPGPLRVSPPGAPRETTLPAWLLPRTSESDPSSSGRRGAGGRERPPRVSGRHQETGKELGGAGGTDV